MSPTAEHFFTEVQGIKTHFIRLGQAEQKVIFLHGWGGSTQSFWPMALELRAARPDLELILLDYPGFGDTDNPPPSGFSSADYADWVKSFCDQQNITKAHFYTHSNGGRMLIPLMQAHPELGQKLVFSASAGVKWPDTLKQKFSKWASLRFAKAKRKFPAQLQKFVVTKVLGARDWGNVEPALKTTLTKILAEDDAREKLANIKQPSLVLWGERDQITPLKSGQVFAKKLPNNQFVTFKTGRHGIHHTHRAEIVERLTQFF